MLGFLLVCLLMYKESTEHKNKVVRNRGIKNPFSSELQQDQDDLNFFMPFKAFRGQIAERGGYINNKCGIDC